mmetsp:Transcript_53526/g.139468  ORF Transcript_53526/g.139468 Transcript_53526/m.139468 type:complete len:80 (+) Transcript_53526:458-697(+)
MAVLNMQSGTDRHSSIISAANGERRIRQGAISNDIIGTKSAEKVGDEVQLPAIARADGDEGDHLELVHGWALHDSTRKE